MSTRKTVAVLAAAFVLPWALGPAVGLSARQAQPTPLEAVLNQLTFRNIGPFRPGR